MEDCFIASNTCCCISWRIVSLHQIRVAAFQGLFHCIKDVLLHSRNDCFVVSIKDVLLQQAHGWSRPSKGVLRYGACWPEVVGVTLLGYTKRRNHQHVHPVDDCQQSSSCQHPPLLTQDLQTQAHPRLVRRIRCESTTYACCKCNMSCVTTFRKATHWSGLWVASACVTCAHERKGGPHRAPTSKRALCTHASLARASDTTTVCEALDRNLGHVLQRPNNLLNQH